jgi:hypothetical protein
MDRRQPGCLSGLLKLGILNVIYNFFQRRVGYGRRGSCAGLGCGTILFVLFIIIACYILFTTNWFQFGF